MKNYENEKTSKLERRIEKAIEKECMKRGLMGNEGVSVTLQLTDEEKNEFLKTDLGEKYDWWEFETDGKLTVSVANLDKVFLASIGEVELRGENAEGDNLSPICNGYQDGKINGEWNSVHDTGGYAVYEDATTGKPYAVFCENEN